MVNMGVITIFALLPEETLVPEQECRPDECYLNTFRMTQRQSERETIAMHRRAKR
jgi:hypothetical protein